LQAIVETTAQAITTDTAAEYTHGNAMSLAQLETDPNVEIRPFPDEVLRLLRAITQEVVAEQMSIDPAFAKIGKAYLEFLEKASANSRLTELAYLRARDL
jgi:TRAP-type mannitol/chloroaromatic compound transport system substrate-binding protein